MSGRTWNLLLTLNSVIWTFSLGFLVYAFCMLFIALEWKQCVFAFAFFIATCAVETILGTMAN